MGNFKNVFKNLRLQNGYTQDTLAKALKISRTAISMYERGNREPDFETLEIIADFFNVDMDYLLGRSDIRKKFILTKMEMNIEVSKRIQSQLMRT